MKQTSSYYVGHTKESINCIRGENPVNESFFPKKLIKDIDFFRYPNPLSFELREKLSQYTSISAKNILCTNGSDEALSLTISLLNDPNSEVIICPPTFFNYEKFAKFAKANVVSILRKYDFSLDISQILSSITSKTKLIIIDSPGNPCGALVSKKDIESLLKTGIDVIVDEAYFEYCQISVIELFDKYSNLIITRSLSKWAGLAGLRVGYLIARETIISDLESMKVPCNVNSVGQKFACYALQHKEEFFERLKEIIELRESAIRRLKRISGITILPSHTAFFIIKLNNLGNASYAQEYLEKNNILVMALDQPLLENSLRVNVGTSEDLEVFCSVFERWISVQKGNFT